MADNAISSGSVIRPYRSPFGSPLVRYFGNNASTFLRGQIVMASTIGSTSSGRVEQASSLSTAIVGVAAEDPSTQTSGVMVYMAHPDCEFVGFAKGTLSDTQRGRCVSFAYDSSVAVHYINLGNSSAGDARVQVTDLIDAAGDSNGLVAFKFLIQDTGEASTRGYNLAWYR